MHDDKTLRKLQETWKRMDEDNPCWDGYEKVPGKKDYEDDSCRKKKAEEGMIDGLKSMIRPPKIPQAPKTTDEQPDAWDEAYNTVKSMVQSGEMEFNDAVNFVADTIGMDADMLSNYINEVGGIY